MNTAPTGGAWVRGEGAPWTSGYDRDFRAGREFGGRGRGYGAGPDRGPGLNTGAYDRDLRGGAQGRGAWTRAGSQRGFDQGDQGYAGGGGEYDPRYARGGRRGGGYDRGYDRR